MSKRRPTQEERHNNLNPGHFGASRDLKPADPLAPTPMVVEIDRLQEYDHNPRKITNPRYDDIEASIRAQGLQQPLVITRRPGDERYMVKHGGNTRLQILKALHLETGDDRFARVHCLFEPWVSESETLTAHLIENDTRGDLSFIDKARAVQELRTLLIDETGEQISQLRLATLLRERGYRLDQSTICRMDYAMELLWPVIPEALRAGLGVRQVRNIRRMELALCQFLEHRSHSADEIETERLWFIQCLARHDGPEWDTAPLQHDVIEYLASTCHEDPARVRLDYDALLAGESAGPDATLSAELPDPRRSRSPEPPRAPTSNPSPAETASVEGPTPDSRVVDAPTTVGARPPTVEPGPKPAAGEGIPFDGTDNDERVLPASAVAGSIKPGDLPDDLKSLRGRMWTLAARLAQHNGLGECIQPINRGPGFIVDLPETPLGDFTHGTYGATATERKRVGLWWFLICVCEQLILDHASQLRVLPEASPLRPILDLLREGSEVAATQAETAIVGTVGRMDLEACGEALLSRLNDAEFRDLVALLDTRRRIHAVCVAEHKSSIWGL